MNRPPFLHRLLKLVPVCVLPVFAHAEPGPPPPSGPNVLFIAIDDLRTELGCYGVEEVSSPHIDRLAGKGMLFRRAYVQYPVCNPSRSSFLSGLRPNETGIVSNTVPFRKELPDLVTLPQAFRRNGWYTAGIGKIFHLGMDPKGRPALFQDPASWDHFFDKLNGAPRIGRTGEGRNLTDGRLKWCEWRAAEGGDPAQPDWLNTTEALRVLEDHADKPFFIALGLHKPHDPFIAPKEYFERYPEGSTRLADPPADRSPREPLAIPNDRDFAHFTDTERREFKRAYQACVSFADAQVGRILEAMDRLELWEDTIVVLVGDHGYHLGEHDWWNKVTVFELGARAPMIIWAPGSGAMGKETSAIVEFIDLYPTLMELASLQAPHPLSGTSLRPILENPAHPGKQAAYTQVNRGKKVGRSVRTDHWRYTEWGPSGAHGIELYRHPEDPGEYYNLATAEKHAATRAKLKELLDAVLPAGPQK
ncbi:sulfatase [Haloferula sp. A504]|uniref:sulfatase n=1 Tax=Haloferula sp. A504 TaxID=3373601 RepID=UPI0031C42FB1|nr:sulfatase [Verrucomicrobiaceae bacterium E54]